MYELLENIQNNLVAYVVVFGMVGTLLFVFRKQTGPVVFHAIEGSIYAAIFHLAFSLIVLGLSSFKSAAVFDPGEKVATFTTSWWAPWDRSGYSPEWLFYVTCVGWVGIIYLIVFIRPMSSSNQYKGTAPDPKVAAARKSVARGGGSSMNQGASAHYRRARAARKR